MSPVALQVALPAWLAWIAVFFVGVTARSDTVAAPGTAATPAVTAPISDAEWQKTRDTDGIVVWQRDEPASKIRSLRLETTLGASSERIWEVIRDVLHHTEFLPYVAESRVVWRSHDDLQRLVYQRVSPPLVSDRDFTIATFAQIDAATGVYQQSFKVANDSGPLPRVDAVRVTSIIGGWTLEPVDSERTRLFYWVHADPGGVIPSWIINFGNRFSITRLIGAIESRARDPSWRP